MKMVIAGYPCSVSSSSNYISWPLASLQCTCLCFSSHNSLVNKALVTLSVALITVCFIVLFAGEQSLRIYRSFSLTAFRLCNFCTVNSFVLIFVFAEITMLTYSEYLVMERYLVLQYIGRACQVQYIGSLKNELRLLLERKRHIQIRLPVRLSVLRLFFVGHVL